MCEGSHRRVTRRREDGSIETLVERYEGKRLNRPNDVVCKSDGSLWFTDPDLRVPFAERELPYAGVYRIATPAGVFSASLIKTEYQIDILAVVSVRDTLYTFYADGVGKVLVSYTPVSPPPRIESP